MRVCSIIDAIDFHVTDSSICIYTFKTFMCMYVCDYMYTMCVQCLWREEERCWLPWKWRRLWATMQVLGTKTKSFAWASSALFYFIFSPAPLFIWKKYFKRITFYLFVCFVCLLQGFSVLSWLKFTWVLGIWNQIFMFLWKVKTFVNVFPPGL